MRAKELLELVHGGCESVLDNSQGRSSLEKLVERNEDVVAPAVYSDEERARLGNFRKSGVFLH